VAGVTFAAMLEEADYILNYLPMRCKSELEDEYIQYLRGAVIVLSEDRVSSVEFALMPFHMLFMLAMQYKALRVSRAMPERYELIYTLRNLRAEEQCLLTPSSAFDFSKLQESCFFDIFTLLKVDDALIRDAKNLVRRRNDLAHANGIIDADPQGTISEYFQVLKKLQPYCLDMNDAIAGEWLCELQEGENKNEFMEARLASSYLCPADFESGGLALSFPL